MAEPMRPVPTQPICPATAPGEPDRVTTSSQSIALRAVFPGRRRLSRQSKDFPFRPQSRLGGVECQQAVGPAVILVDERNRVQS